MCTTTPQWGKTEKQQTRNGHHRVDRARKTIAIYPAVLAQRDREIETLFRVTKIGDGAS